MAEVSTPLALLVVIVLFAIQVLGKSSEKCSRRERSIMITVAAAILFVAATGLTVVIVKAPPDKLVPASKIDPKASS